MENKCEELSALKKQDSQGEPVRYNESANFIHDLIRKFNNNFKSFEAEETYNFIKDFLNEKAGLDRILYSELNKCIGFESERIDGINALTENIGILFRYAVKKYDEKELGNIDRDCIRVITKIFDHINLYVVQKRNYEKMESSITSSITADVTKEVTEKIKSGVEREYITILSIFSAVILAFVGGLTYSTSVLTNIDKVEFSKLLLTCDVIGFFVFNIILLLILFLCTLNKIKSWFYIIMLIVVNVSCIVLALKIMEDSLIFVL